MSKSEPIALIDLDGTIADFNGAMHTELIKIASPGEQAYFEEHSDEPRYITERRRLIKRQPGWWENLPRFQLGFDVVEMLLKLDYQLNVLSKAPRGNFDAWGEKVRWCHKNLPMSEGIKISLVEDKGLHYGKVLVDDWPDYVNRWLERRPRGLVIMPAHPYNAEFKHSQVIRYDGVNYNEVYEALKKQRETCEE